MNPESPYTTPVNTPPVMTVTALNQAVAQLLERNLPLTWVSGEFPTLPAPRLDIGISP